MQKKGIKYIGISLIILALCYNSVYFKSLSEVKAASSVKFDAVEYAQAFWNEKLIPNLSKAVDINYLIQHLKSNKEQVFSNYSHALGIGNIRYFLIKGQGEIIAIGDDDVTISIQKDSSRFNVLIATEFIYGNAVRDALGMLDINAFSNTMDLNNISAEIDNKIRKEVIPPFKAASQEGQIVEFVGAIELNQKYLNLENIEVIPVSLTVKQ